FRVPDKSDVHCFRIPGRASFWQRCLGLDSGLLVSIRLEPVATGQPRLLRALVRVQPCGRGGRQAVHEQGENLIRSLLQELQARFDLRKHSRRPFSDPVRVYPVAPGREPSQAIEGTCLDLNPEGVGLLLRRAPGTEYVYLALPATPALAGAAVLARIAWVE